MIESLPQDNYFDRGQNIDPFLVTPEAARARIEALGFPAEHIKQILRVGAKDTSHELYAYAVIASQNETRNINDVYHELYPLEKAAETAADVQARQAADQAEANGSWEQFMQKV